MRYVPVATALHIHVTSIHVEMARELLAETNVHVGHT
jgi:hypothetical protein